MSSSRALSSLVITASFISPVIAFAAPSKVTVRKGSLQVVCDTRTAMPVSAKGSNGLIITSIKRTAAQLRRAPAAASIIQQRQLRLIAAAQRLCLRAVALPTSISGSGLPPSVTDIVAPCPDLDGNHIVNILDLMRGLNLYAAGTLPDFDLNGVPNQRTDLSALRVQVDALNGNSVACSGSGQVTPTATPTRTPTVIPSATPTNSPTPTATNTPTPPPSPAPGGIYTMFPSVTGMQRIYVSSSSGSDANSGLSTSSPVKTIARGYSLLRDGFPDQLLLKKGDIFNDPPIWWTKSGVLNVPGVMQPGQTANGYMVLGSYGSGARPQWRTFRDAGIYMYAPGSPRGKLAIVGLELFQDGNRGISSETGGSPALGIYDNWSNVLIEDCLFRNFYGNISLENVGTNSGPKNVFFNAIVNVDSFGDNVPRHNQGIYMGAVTNWKIANSVFDNNGHGLPGQPDDMFNHNLYINASSGPGEFVDNITARAGSHGLKNEAGGVTSRNLALKNSVNLFNGTNNANVLSDNVVLNAKNINATGNLIGTGIDAYGDGIVLSNNIIAHQKYATANIDGFSLHGFGGLLENNIVYRWDNSGLSAMPLALGFYGASSWTVVNNDFQQVAPVNGGGIVLNPGSASAYSGNRWFSTNNSSQYPGPGYPSSGGSIVRVTYPPNAQCPGGPEAATIEGYMTKLGLTPTLEAFLGKAREMSKDNFDTRFTSAAVRQYIRSCFGR